MKVFLTGATGYVGSQVAKRLLNRGDSVTGLVRSPGSKQLIESQGMDAVIGDLAEPASFSEAVSKADAVIHTAFNHDGDFFEEVKLEKAAVDTMLAALSKSNKRLITTSGSGVLGDTGGVPVDETFPVNWEFPASVRAKLEVACKDAATDGVHSCVLRLPVLVYGNGQSQFVPALINAAQQHGVSYYVGDGSNCLSSVHVEDVADAFILALDQAPAGSLYNIANDETVLSRDLAEAIAAAADVKRAESTTLEKAGNAIHPFIALLLSMNNVISGAAAKQDLNWQTGKHPRLMEDIYHGSYAGLAKSA